MNGGLSQVDSFDPKPMLDKYDGQPLPGGTIATERKTGELMKSPFTFKKYGQCGMDVSELFPNVGELRRRHLLDPLVYTDIPNHEPSMLMMNTGHKQVGPALDGLVADLRARHRQQEPARLRRAVSRHADHRRAAAVEQRFLPAVHQGTFISDKVEKPDEIVGKDFDPKKLVSFVNNDKFTLPEQRRELDLLEQLDRMRNTATHSRSAARGGDAVDGSGLPDADRGAGCLRHPQGERGHARTVRPGQHGARLPDGACGSSSSGVRMVQVYYAKGDPVGRAQRHPGAPQEREGFRPAVCRRDQGSEVARPVRGHAGRLRLRVRPHAGRARSAAARGSRTGRDHNPFGFTMWLAGGGVKGGTIYGATDDFGFKAIEKPVHVHDLHATILHLMGIDHTKLTYRYSGRDFRLTDVSGKVIQDILA